MTLNLSPKIEAALNAAARQNGVDIETLIERLVQEKYPTAEETATPKISAKNDAAIAYNDAAIAYLERRLQARRSTTPKRSASLNKRSTSCCKT